MNVKFSSRQWTWVDTCISIAFVGALVWLVIHVSASLKYSWDWQELVSYFIYFQEDEWKTGLIFDGLMMSLRLMVLGGILTFIVGGLVATAALSPITPLRIFAKLYVEGLRHIPPVVFMFIFFFFISSQLFATDLWFLMKDNMKGPFWQFLLGPEERVENLIGGLLCLVIFEASFVSEVLRAGVLSIHSGQWEAAKSMGLSRWPILRLIILPQVLARVAAPLVGQLIFLVKDSSILSIISVQELTFSAQESAISSQQVFETWLFVAVLYFILCSSLLAMANRLEKWGKSY